MTTLSDEMTKAIIPYRPLSIDLPSENTNFLSESFFKNRGAVLSELRCVSGISKIASTLNQDTVYKLVSTPAGGKLFKDSAGNIKGVFYKNGKIIEHAKFKTVHPSLVKAATTVGSQVILISIAMQLNQIEKGISGILNEFHNDRISEIFSGVKLFKHAMLVQDNDRQSRMIENAIPILNTGIEKTIRSLKMQIEDAPNAKAGLWDNWLANEAIVAKEKFALAEESFKTCLLGIKTLSECYATINEANAASAALVSNLSNLKSSGIEIAAQKARLIPVKANKLPEKPWLSFLEKEPSLINESNRCRLLANDEFEKIEIEFKPIELLEK